MSTVVVVVAEELRHNMEKQEVHYLGDTTEGCTHPLISIVPHGPIWVWISPQGLLILPWKVSVIPH